MSEKRGQINAEQWAVLVRHLNGARVQTRSQAGNSLSYLAAWDVKAHLTRIFGFGNWDSEVLEYAQAGQRMYQNQQNKEMVEVVYTARVRLTIRDAEGSTICVHSEAAAGSAAGPFTMLGDHHDNALKTAASDALKRCAINLGTQFGLSLYDNGSRNDVIKDTIIKPEGAVHPLAPTDEQAARLAKSLGVGASEIAREVAEQDISHG